MKRENEKRKRDEVGGKKGREERSGKRRQITWGGGGKMYEFRRDLPFFLFITDQTFHPISRCRRGLKKKTRKKIRKNLSFLT